MIQSFLIHAINRVYPLNCIHFYTFKHD